MSEPKNAYQMSVSVIQGKNLPKSDRYLIHLKVKGSSIVLYGTVNTNKKSQSPVWNHRFDSVLESKPQGIILEIYNDDVVRKKLVGKIEYQVTEANWTASSPYIWQPIEGCGSASNLSNTNHGELQFQVSFRDFKPKNAEDLEVIREHLQYMETIGLLTIKVCRVKEDKTKKISRNLFRRNRELQIVVKHGLSAFRTGVVPGPNPTFDQEGRVWIKQGEEKYILRIGLYNKSKRKFSLIGRGFVDLGSISTSEAGEYTYVVDLSAELKDLTDAQQTEMISNLNHSSNSLHDFVLDDGDEETSGTDVDMQRIDSEDDLDPSNLDVPNRLINQQDPDNKSVNSTTPLTRFRKTKSKEKLKLIAPSRPVNHSSPVSSPKVMRMEPQTIAFSDDLHFTDSFVDACHRDKSQPVVGQAIIRVKFSPKDDVEKWFYRRLLEEFDANGDGHLDVEEVHAMFASVGHIAQINVDDLIQQLKRDGEDEIDEEELLCYLQSAEFNTHPLAYSLLAFLADGHEGLACMISDRYTVADTHLKMTKTGAGILCVNDGHRIQKDKFGLKVMHRQTGLIVDENIPKYIKLALNVLYAKRTTKHAVQLKKIQKVLYAMSRREGNRMDDPASVVNIRPFIKLHKLDESEWLYPVDENNHNYKNFNSFFYRKLKPSARPIESKDDDCVAVSCADCRMVVFEGISQATKLWIKGSKFTIESLLTDELADVAPSFVGGSLVIARLAPQDYHRWHMPVSGKLGRRVDVEGALFTVNPIAVRQALNVYTENRRIIEEIHSEEFGLVMLVCIGATMVGSVNITAEPEGDLKKGDEHGFFAFGGSTILILFQPGKIKFDNDLYENSQKPLETLVQVGMRIGEATSTSNATSSMSADQLNNNLDQNTGEPSSTQASSQSLDKHAAGRLSSKEQYKLDSVESLTSTRIASLSLVDLAGPPTPPIGRKEKIEISSDHVEK